ncbi:capsid protein 1 [Pileated finch aveparvovirus]|uniref:Capsid protein 1 n=1 Tax=Pileated finch aveparvovirus TaxID=2137544 RepID=A0A2Z3DB37_9VIRU|nr:capsid protein 1 [Pileated finch aveparvovirus]AVR53748.1 capsid protein 1 [Pileated finch aveparvovirus]
MKRPYSPRLPTNEAESYHYNRWWIDHVSKGHVIGGKATGKGVKTPGKQLTDQQKQSRKRFFIVQAQQKKKAEGNPKFGIPTSSQHKRFFANHTGNKGGGKAKAKTKHIEPGYQPPNNQDPDEGPAPKLPRRQLNWEISQSQSSETAPTQAPQKSATPAASRPATPDNVLETVMSHENEVEMPQMPEAPSQSGLAADDGPGSGGGGGGGGVGNSTGNWTCETIWGDNYIVTNASRHCVCLPRNEDSYKLISNSTNGDTINQTEQSMYLGWTTPWNYLDFNQYAIHFKPSDWQRLLNTASRWRPRRVHVKIFNIQVIQKTEVNDAWQFNNDLTGTIQVFADQENRYPKLMYPCQTSMMGPFPNMIYYCPQYGYLASMTQASSQTNMLTLNTQFFCLDEASSTMLRTGNNWSSSFEFGPDTPWCSNRRTARHITRRMNPLYDTWNTNIQGQDCMTGSFSTWRSPWLSGPWMDLYEAAENETMPNSSHVYVGGTALGLNPGPPPGQATNAAHKHTFWVPKKGGMNEGDISDHYIDANSATTISIDDTRTYFINPQGAYKTRASSNTGGDNGGKTILQHMTGLFPDMMWDNRPASYWDNIWQEYPESDNKTIMTGRLGGIPVEAAPGHIFCKVTPKPSGDAGSYLIQFATFTVTVSIEWEYETNSYSQWNQRPLISWNTQSALEYDGLCDENGKYLVACTDRAVEQNYLAKVHNRTN